MKSGETISNSQRETATTSFDAQGDVNNGRDSGAGEVLDAETPSDDVASEANPAQQDTSTSVAQEATSTEDTNTMQNDDKKQTAAATAASKYLLLNFLYDAVGSVLSFAYIADVFFYK